MVSFVSSAFSKKNTAFPDLPIKMFFQTFLIFHTLLWTQTVMNAYYKYQD